MRCAEDLVLLAGLLEDEVVSALTVGDMTAVSRLLCGRLAAGEQAGRPLDRYVLGLLLQEESFWARQAASGAAVSPLLMRAAADEIAILQAMLREADIPTWLGGHDEGLPEGWPSLYFWRDLNAENVAAALTEFYRKSGVGRMAMHRVWRWEGELVAVESPDAIRLTDLVGYQSQKDEVMCNTRLFLESGRGNNLLLYGARGTGKSSLIKAVANELAADGLCLVELPLNKLADLPTLQEILHKQPRHYIIYIDDLSFERADEAYKITKAVLEGSVSGRGGNVLIYATSNRRHLVAEDWRDREQGQFAGGEVRAGDSMSEKLSLADRFGQTVLFTTPDQQEYLNIVRGLAEQDGLDMPIDELERRALQWAMWQNGRSGRGARQFINSLAVSEKA